MLSHEADLHDGQSACKASVSTGTAADGTIELGFPLKREADGFEVAVFVMGRLFAMRTQGADEALGLEGADRGRDHEGLDPHVDETGDAAHRVIGMQS